VFIKVLTAELTGAGFGQVTRLGFRRRLHTLIQWRSSMQMLVLTNHLKRTLWRSIRTRRRRPLVPTTGTEPP
jgi:hypothetical protein